MLEFRTFGAIEVRTPDGDRLTSLPDQPKRLALLGVLAARPPGEPVRREKLVSLLWPESAPSAGRSALNTTLSRLRRELGEEVFLGAGGRTLGLSPDHFRADVQRFLEAVEEGRPRDAAELYRGPFLEGLRLSGNRPFERWLEDRRSALRRRACRSALRAGEAAREEGDPEAAVAALRRALEIDPFREEAAAGLIRVLGRLGRPSDALEVHDRFQARRREELDLPPSGELREVVDRIAAGSAAPRPDDSGSGGPAPGGDPPSPSGTAAAADGDGAGPRRSLPRLGSAALAAVAAAAVGAWALLAPGADEPAAAGRSVAVLPFHVSGTADPSWGDGMVTVLSSRLDGAGGLRAVADRTVLATWEKTAADGSGAEWEEALSAARAVGARYAVVGSAVELGPELRFTADVLRAGSGESLGRVEVRGPPDSAAALADDLARRVIGLLEERTDETVRRAEVASLSTHSVSALKSYLEGEKHLRAGEAGAAMDDFRAAIRADSAFALPYARIGLYGFWRAEDGGRATRRAYELSDALPRRDRRLVRALHLAQIEHRTLAAADSFRRLSGEYPDDPAVWSSLGELVFHSHIPGGVPEFEDAHERAVALDPGHTAYHDHYVGPAFTLHHDSALAASRVRALPDGEWKRMYRFGLDLAFGAPEAAEEALGRLDTARIHEPWLAFGPLEGPEEKGMLDRLLRRLLEREDVPVAAYAPVLFVNDLHRGQVGRALRDAERLELPPALTACFLAESITLGYPVPDSVAHALLAPASLPEDPPPGRLKCTALYLIEQGRGERLDGLVDRLRASVDTAADGGVPAGQLEAVVQELRGYRAWREGELRRAARLLGRSNESFNAGAIWRGDLHRALGHFDRAEGWYRAAWRHPVSYERLGRLYEERGEAERAVAAYRRFVGAWEDADDALRGRVEAARERVRRLADGAAAASGAGTE